MIKTARHYHDPAAEAVTAIDKLKELQPNWDSYGAGAPDLHAREQAKGFVYAVAEKLGPEYAHPRVGPTADGGVALIWRRPGHPKVEVFFAPDGPRFAVMHARKLLDKGPVTSLTFLKQYLAL
jgi:hypothetical protein